MWGKGKMKVNFFNKKIINKFFVRLSPILTIISVIGVFTTYLQNNLFIFYCLLFILVLYYIGLVIYANYMNKKELKINNTTIIIKYGDLFKEKGLKVISFNEYFDTEVNENLISKNTLNGKFLCNHKEELTAINDTINFKLKNNDNFIANNYTRKFGKNPKYKLGTIVKYNEFLFTALTHFDDSNAAYMTIEDYFIFALHFWSEVNKVYNGENIVIPLLGSGITRKQPNTLSNQNLLQILLNTYKYSNLSFNSCFMITIVLNEKIKDEINLFELEN